jgi:hypothetical protein
VSLGTTMGPLDLVFFFFFLYYYYYTTTTTTTTTAASAVAVYLHRCRSIKCLVTQYHPALYRAKIKCYIPLDV